MHPATVTLIVLVALQSAAVLCQLQQQQPAVDSNGDFASIGQNIGISLLDGLLKQSQLGIYRSELQRQASAIEQINPKYAEFLRNLPPEYLVVAQQASVAAKPSTGNPWLDLLASNGLTPADIQGNIGTNGSDSNAIQQRQPQLTNILGNVLTGVLKQVANNRQTPPGILPDIPERTNPNQPDANSLILPESNPEYLRLQQLLLQKATKELHGVKQSSVETDNQKPHKTQSIEAKNSAESPSTSTNIIENLHNPNETNTNETGISEAGKDATQSTAGSSKQKHQQSPTKNSSVEGNKVEAGVKENSSAVAKFIVRKQQPSPPNNNSLDTLQTKPSSAPSQPLSQLELAAQQLIGSLFGVAADRPQQLHDHDLLAQQPQNAASQPAFDVQPLIPSWTNSNAADIRRRLSQQLAQTELQQMLSQALLAQLQQQQQTANQAMMKQPVQLFDGDVLAQQPQQPAAGLRQLHAGTHSDSGDHSLTQLQLPVLPIAAALQQANLLRTGGGAQLNLPVDWLAGQQLTGALTNKNQHSSLAGADWFGGPFLRRH